MQAARSRRKRALEVAFAAILLGLLAVVSLRLPGLLLGPADWAACLAGLLLGVLLTDFISGLVHWLCDTYGDERTPVLGPLLIAPFREHHRYPQRMVERSFLEVNLSNSVGAVGTLLLVLGLDARAGAAAPTALGQGFLLGLAAAIYLTNTFHQWAHDPNAPALARWLQRGWLAIDPKRHARHHARGYGAFCITTGWLNPLLDRFQVFPRTERALAQLAFTRPSPRSSGMTGSRLRRNSSRKPLMASNSSAGR